MEKATPALVREAPRGRLLGERAGYMLRGLGVDVGGRAVALPAA
ncbi:hypothetical protein P186_2670 [Pyrobaculum ferrireducens]|uniref:Uncharacterized protein n=1 Tax=Pyrobaculum ferrireducens TaxID=1104324 RepID=G7VE84_9CREN|nr:hypothetical protein P186_2670 [Pyrobaculum ferrireducens]